MRALSFDQERTGRHYLCHRTAGRGGIRTAHLEKQQPASATRQSTAEKTPLPGASAPSGPVVAEKSLATSMMTSPMAFSSDLRRLCASSGVGARVESAKLPVVRLANAGRESTVDPVQLALHGGDDYELLFTVRQTR